MLMIDKTVREAPLHAISAIVLALADWLAFGLNIATTMHAYWPVTVATALAGGGLVLLIQVYRSKDGWLPSLVKGLFCAVFVAVPLPVLGTAVALVALTWAWMSAGSRES